MQQKSPILSDTREGHEIVVLYLSCRGLKNTDTLSKSDPQITVNLDGKEIGKTELIKDNLNPDFTTAFPVPYYFEKKQNMTFTIRDIDKGGKFDDLGTVSATLGQIVGSKNQTAILPIILKSKEYGRLIVKTEIKPKRVVVVQEGDEQVKVEIDTFAKIEVSGNLNPIKAGCCQPSLPSSHFKFSRVMTNESGNSTIIHSSNAFPKSLNPLWQEFEEDLHKICGYDKNIPLTLEVFNGTQLLGSCSFDFDQMEKGQVKDQALSNNAGTISVNKCTLINREKTQPQNKNKKKRKIQNWPHTFLEYLRGGIQINAMVAIDFTLSNGILHSTNPKADNQYQRAIKGVSDIILHYDYDKKVPVYGFGGEYTDSKKNHCFPMNGNDDDPEVYGMEGILSTYEAGLKKYNFYYPTYFGYVLETAVQKAREAKQQGSLAYNILLILTDGVIDDMEKSIDLCVEGSELPLSVIIVGVGSANFDNMEKLDADEEALVSSDGVQAKRDIVQFVPFRQFQNNKERLAEEVLAEVPTQFTEYYMMQNIKPKINQEADQELNINLKNNPQNNDGGIGPQNVNIHVDMGPNANVMK